MTTLNIARPAGEVETTGGEAVEVTRFPDPVPPKLHLQFDIESLDLGPRPIITQVAMYALDLDEDELLDRSHYFYYPVQPQLQLATPRTFSFDTLAWWMKQSDEARAKFEMSGSQDFEELPSLLRHLTTTFKQITNDGTIPYEIWAKGPQFDLVAIETLMQDCGIEVPWKYDTVRDLRTLLALAGINPKNIPQPAGFVGHAANWDAKYQINQYREAIKALRAR